MDITAYLDIDAQFCDQCGEKSKGPFRYVKSGLQCCPIRKLCLKCYEQQEDNMGDGLSDALKECNVISISESSKPMNKNEYLEYHKQACEKMMAITKAKNADYTGVGDDPFANFTRVESVGICSTEQGFLTRMMDKVCRINSFVQKGTLEVKEESVEDTLFDLANYSIMMAAYIKSKNNKKGNK